MLKVYLREKDVLYVGKRRISETGRGWDLTVAKPEGSSRKDVRCVRVYLRDVVFVF